VGIKNKGKGELLISRK